MNCIKTDDSGCFITASPESQGVSGESIVRLLDGIRAQHMDIHSLHIFRNGYQIAGGCASPYSEKKMRRIYSTGKSVSALAVYFAIGEGKLRFEDRLVDYFPDMLPDSISDNLAALTVENMLMMSTGMREDGLKSYYASGKTLEMAKSFFSCPVIDKPGSRFFYNNAVPEMLGMLVERVTGQKFTDYLKPRLFEPLGAFYQVDETAQGWLDGSTTISTINDLCKFTLFYLQTGMWNGVQLLDRSIMKRVTESRISTASIAQGRSAYLERDEHGYLMQLWGNAFGGFRLFGAFGQVGMCLPEKNMAIVYTGMNMTDTDAIIRNTVFSSCFDEPLPENRQSHTAIQEAFHKWTVFPSGLLAHCGEEIKYQGKRYQLTDNEYGIEELGFDFTEQRIYMRQKGKEYAFSYGLCGAFSENGSWIDYVRDCEQVYRSNSKKAYLSAGWEKNEFIFEVRHDDNMIAEFVQIKFSDDGITAFCETSLDRCLIFKAWSDQRDDDCVVLNADNYRKERTSTGRLINE